MFIDPHTQPFGTNIPSIMLAVKVDRDEPTNLHEQVAAAIRRAIADVEAGPGERVPPARDLAAELGANTKLCCARCGCCALRGSSSYELRAGRVNVLNVGQSWEVVPVGMDRTERPNTGRREERAGDRDADGAGTALHSPATPPT
jgi:GntR family transcriptional regulator